MRPTLGVALASNSPIPGRDMEPVPARPAGVSLGVRRALWHAYLDYAGDEVTRSLMLVGARCGCGIWKPGGERDAFSFAMDPLQPYMPGATFTGVAHSVQGLRPAAASEDRPLAAAHAPALGALARAGPILLMRTRHVEIFCDQCCPARQQPSVQLRCSPFFAPFWRVFTLFFFILSVAWLA